MPDIAAHREMGGRVLAQLPFSLEEGAFRAGLYGPDPWLLYRFWLPMRRRRVKIRGKVMHRERTGEFLEALAGECVGNSWMLAYTAGCVCHWRLDAAAHPYIIRRGKEKRGGHASLERELDRRVDGGPRPATRVKVQPLPREMREALERAYGVYGWRGAWKDLNKALRDTERFLWLAEDPHGVLKLLLGWHAGARSYLYSWHEPWDDPENNSHRYGAESFTEMMNRSVEEAAGWVMKLWEYAQGKGPKPVFPEESYEGGNPSVA